MTEYVFLIIVFLLALVGFLQLIKWAAIRLLVLPKEETGIHIYCISGHRTDLEYLIRASSAHRRWGAIKRVVLLDNGMDSETRRLAEFLCEECASVQLYNADQLGELLREGSSS